MRAKSDATQTLTPKLDAPVCLIHVGRANFGLLDALASTPGRVQLKRGSDDQQDDGEQGQFHSA